MSMTGNVKQFVNSLELDDKDVVEIGDNINPLDLNGEKYLLIVPTYDEFMTECIDEFIEINGKENCVGSIGSGNLNFGDDMYIFTVKNLQRDYNIPVLHGFEYAGFENDIIKVKEIIKNLNKVGE